MENKNNSAELVNNILSSHLKNYRRDSTLLYGVVRTDAVITAKTKNLEVAHGGGGKLRLTCNINPKFS